MKQRKWKIVVYVNDKGLAEHDGSGSYLDAQAIEVYLKVGLDSLTGPEVTWKIKSVQQLKA